MGPRVGPGAMSTGAGRARGGTAVPAGGAANQPGPDTGTSTAAGAGAAAPATASTRDRNDFGDADLFELEEVPGQRDACEVYWSRQP